MGQDAPGPDQRDAVGKHGAEVQVMHHHHHAAAGIGEFARDLHHLQLMGDIKA